MHWVDARVSLPTIIDTPNEHGTTSSNFVLVRYADHHKIHCGSQYQTSNTHYVNKFPHQFSHWAYIEDPFDVISEDDIQEYLGEQHVRDITFRNCI